VHMFSYGLGSLSRVFLLIGCLLRNIAARWTIYRHGHSSESGDRTRSATLWLQLHPVRLLL